jgi:pyridoxal phosphate enzyme (YggS family)
MDRDLLRSRLTETRTRIASATSKYERPANSVGLVAISKSHPAEAIRVLAELGQRDFGENYLQEALPKLEALSDLDLVWHFTGQLQSNKTRVVAEHFDWVHTLDRERIAVRLNEQRPHHAPLLNVCIQVRLEDEPGKGGVAPHELIALASRVRELPRLKLRGLMCIPPPEKTFADQRKWFDQLDTLSMGMSDDVEAAIAAGATWVRIGTALFGPR